MVLDEARKHFSLQNNIIWVKHIKINNNTHGQYRPSTSDYHLSNTWEHVFHLTKNKTVIDSTNFVGEYEIGLWNSEEDKTKLHAYRARRRISKNMGFTTLNEAEKSEIFKQKVAEYLEQKPYQHKEQKDEGAVWYIPYEPVSREFNTSDHPAIFPVALPENCILMASDEGDLVYDPFSGSFTTGVAAIKTRRSFVGTELSPDYCKFGTKRLEQAINQFQSKSNIVQTTTWI
jgi:site-specific DNA-methyltransferase (adenine-specific)